MVQSIRVGLWPSGVLMNIQVNAIDDREMNNCSKKSPRVSIGMPVYNGENYIEQALDSLLEQRMKDFELIISNNGSTDRTDEICRKYAADDRRICYYQNELNRGAAWNFNRVYRLSKGEYFMWAAHDDLWSPEFLEKCVQALDNNQDVILCYTSTEMIDEQCNILKIYFVNTALASENAHVRFGASWRYPPQIPVFGLIRSDVLGRTCLIGNYSSSDRTLVGELALQGPMYGVPDYLFHYRYHKQQSTGVQYRTRRARRAWYDPEKTDSMSFPVLRLCVEYIKSISRAPLNIKERTLTYASLARWVVRKRKQLLN